MKKLLVLILTLAILSLSVLGFASCSAQNALGTPDDGGSVEDGKSNNNENSEADGADGGSARPTTPTEGDGQDPDTPTDNGSGGGNNSDSNDGSGGGNSDSTDGAGSGESGSGSTDDGSTEIPCTPVKGTSRMNAIPLTLGAQRARFDDDIFEDGIMYFEFTPTESGYYSFSTGSAQFPYLYIFDDQTDTAYVAYTDTAGDTLSHELEANHTYYVKVASASVSDADYFMNTAKPKAGGIMENALSILDAPSNYSSLIDYDYIWFYYTPTESGSYKFSLNGTGANHDRTVYNAEKVAQTSNGDYYSLQKGSTYYIKFGVVDHSAITGPSVSLLVGDSFDNAIELSLNTYGGSGYVSGAHSENSVYFSFTPTESGYYSFRTNAEGYPTLFLYTEGADGEYTALSESFSLEADGAIIAHYLTAGEKYYIKAVTPDDDYTVIPYFTVGTAYHNAYEITCGTNPTQYYEYLMCDDELWFVFIPESTDFYKLELVGANKDYGLTLYQYGETYELSAGEGGYFSLEAGLYYSLHVSGIDTYDDFGISVLTPEGDRTDRRISLSLGANESGYNIFVNQTNEMYFSFTPSESGWYKLYTDDAYYTDIYLYDSNGYCLTYSGYTDSDSTSLIYELYATDTYYINLGFPVGIDADFTLNVEKAAVGESRGTAIELTLGDLETGYIPGTHSQNEMFFSFTPTESGFYRFYTGDSIYPEFYLYSSVYDEVAYYMAESNRSDADSSCLEAYLYAYNTYYLRVLFAHEYDTSFTLSVTEASTGAVMGDAVEIYEGYRDTGYIEGLHSGGEMYFKFTPGYSGTYKLLLLDASPAELYLYDTVTDAVGSYIAYSAYTDGESNSLECELSAGTTYYVRVRFTDRPDESYTLMLARVCGSRAEGAIELPLGWLDTGYDPILHSDNEMYFSFTPSESGWYSFGVSGCFYPALYLYDAGYSDDDSYIAYTGYTDTYSASLIYELTAGERYCLRVVFASNYDTKYTVTTERIAPGAIIESAIGLTEGATETGYVRGAHSENEIYFKFTPTVSGSYKFYSDNVNYSYLYLYDSVYDGDDDYLTYVSYTDADSVSLTYNLAAGETYYLRVYFTSSCDTSFTLNIERMRGTSKENALALSYGYVRASYISGVHSGGELYFEFTPTESGYHTFYSTDAAYAHLYLYDSATDSNSDYLIHTSYVSSYRVGLTYNLTAGATYYLRISFSTSYGTNIAINVQTDVGNRMDNAIELGEGSLATGYMPGVHSSNEMYFEFTPTESGYYSFLSNDASYAYLYLYDEGGSQLTYAGYSSSESVTLIYELTAGATYYLRIYFANDYDAGFTLSVSEADIGGSSFDSAVKIRCGSAATASITYGGQYIYFIFTAKVAGSYSFYSSGSYDAYGHLYNSEGYELDYNDDSAGSSQFLITRTLSAGETVYIGARMWSSSQTGSYSVHVSRPQDGSSIATALDIELGEAKTASITTGGQRVYYVFTAESTGTYTFYSSNSNSYDTYGHLYNSLGSQIAYNDDAGEGNNFLITRTLSEGETVYIGARMYSSSKTGSFTVHVSTVDGNSMDNATELSLGALSTGYVSGTHTNNEMYFSFTPEESGWYAFYSNDASYAYLYLFAQDGSQLTYAGYTGSNSVTLNYELTAGETYYLRIYFSSGYDTSFTINVAAAAGTAMSNAIELPLGSLSTGYRYGVHTSNEMYFKFTPSEDGWYKFGATNANNYFLYLYDSVYDSTGDYLKYIQGSGSSSYLAHELEAGATYYLRISFSSYDTSFTMNTVRMRDGESLGNAIDVTHSGTELAIISTGGQYVYFKFTAPEAGSYQFYSSGSYDTYGYLYNSSGSQITYNDDGVNGNNFLMTYSMYEGETVYIGARMYNSSYTGYFEVHAKRVYRGASFSDAIPLTEGALSTGYNSSYNSGYEMYFSFTPEKSSTYRFYSSNCNYPYFELFDVNGNYITSMSYTGSNSISLTYQLNADNTYYLRVYFMNSYDTSFTMNLSRITGTVIDDATELTIGSISTGYILGAHMGYEMYFEFTPTEDGRYKFYTNEDYGQHELYLYDSAHGRYNDYLAYASNTGSSRSAMMAELRAGTTYYLRLYFTSSYDTSFNMYTYKLSDGACRDNAIELTEGEAVYAGYSSSGHHRGEMYFNFTPTEDGWYRFTASDAYRTYLYLYDGGEEYLAYAAYDSSYSARLEYRLTAGVTYYLRVYFTSSYDTSFSVSTARMQAGTVPELAYPLDFGTNATESYASLTTDSHVWFSFVPELTSHYGFTLVDASGSYGYGVYDVDGDSISKQNGYYPLTAGVTYYVRFTGIYSNDDFGVRVERIRGTAIDNAIELYEGTNATGYIANGHLYNEMYFEFTPTMDGWYRFYANNEGNHHLYLYDSVYAGDSEYILTAYNSSLEYELTAGVTYYLRLLFPGTADTRYSINASLCNGGISKDSAFELTEGELYTGFIYGLHRDDEMYFKFTPAEDGWYRFFTDDCDYAYLYLYDSVYDSDEDYLTYSSYTDADSVSLVYEMSAGTTYYLRVVFTESCDTSFTLMTERFRGNLMGNAIELYEGEGGTGYINGAHTGGEMYFKFTPAEDGWYDFYAENANNYYLYLYDSAYADDLDYIKYVYYSGTSVRLSYELSAGVTYYLRVYFSGLADEEYTMRAERTRGVDPENAIGLSTGTLSTGYIYGWHRNNVMYFEFTPEIGGVYRFGAANALYPSLYLYGSIYDAEEEYLAYAECSSAQRAELEYELTAGVTYYLRIVFTEDYDTAYTMTVSKGWTDGDSFEHAIRIENGETKPGSFSYGGEMIYYVFTAPSAGTYAFYSSGSYDTYGCLYDANGYQIAYNDNGGDSGNFRLTSSMYAGETVYISACMLTDYDTGSFTLTAEMVKDGTSISSAFDIAEGSSEQVSISYGGQYVYYVFTADSAGTYAFCSSGSYDTYGYLYNSSGSELTHDDDSGDGTNFRITRTLSEGETVYIGVRMYSSSYTGSFYLLAQIV